MRRNWRFVFGFLATAGVLASIANLAAKPVLAGGVEWETREVVLRADEAADQAVARFVFRNVGVTELRVNEVRVGCDCLTAVTDRKTYQPGESGVVIVTMPAGETRRDRSRSVAVVFDRPAAGVELFVHLRNPESVKVEPTILRWAARGMAMWRVVSVRAQDSKLALDAVRSSDPRVEVLVEKSERDGTWRLRVRPTDTREPMQAVLIFQATAGGKITTESVRVLVQ